MTTLCAMRPFVKILRPPVLVSQSKFAQRVCFAGRHRCLELTTKKEQTERCHAAAASVATDVAPVVTSLADVTGTCMTSSADDDERSLDENLRPMDGQIWLPDVDGGLTDTFQTVVTTAVEQNV